MVIAETTAQNSNMYRPLHCWNHCPDLLLNTFDTVTNHMPPLLHPLQTPTHHRPCLSRKALPGAPHLLPNRCLLCVLHYVQRNQSRCRLEWREMQNWCTFMNIVQFLLNSGLHWTHSCERWIPLFQIAEFWTTLNSELRRQHTEAKGTYNVILWLHGKMWLFFYNRKWNKTDESISDNH